MSGPAPRFPFGYHLTLLRGDDGTPFHDPAEQERVWGRSWGAYDEVGQLRTVLVRRPGREYERIDGAAWNDDAGALVDPEGMWYWESREPPVIDRVRAQHDGLIAALTAEGVEVVEVPGKAPEHLTSPIYTRDPLVTVPGGAIVGRLEPAKRRGEELLITRTLASLGMPIIGTIIGTGLLEGGSFIKLTPTVAAYGTSYRCNAESAVQLAGLLRPLGIELVVVPLPAYSIHLDGHLGLVDVDRALIDPLGLPYWFVDRLHDLGFETIPCPPGEEWAINSLALAPGRILMCDGYPRTRELLEARGVGVVAIAYDEIQKGGGGVHCSTMELVRDRA
jgi:N-dimethylarginine dimethylaminohydrolase